MKTNLQICLRPMHSVDLWFMKYECYIDLRCYSVYYILNYSLVILYKPTVLEDNFLYRAYTIDDEFIYCSMIETRDEIDLWTKRRGTVLSK